MIDWRKFPFVRLILPFLLGILTAIYLHSISPKIVLWLVALSLTAIIISYTLQLGYRYKWLIGIPLSMLIFLMGYQLTFYNNELNHTDHYRYELTVNKQFFITTVTDKTEKNDYWRLITEVTDLGVTVDSLKKCTGNLMIYLKKDSLTIPPQYGDLILVQSTVQNIETPKNPEAFDFKRYWHLQNVHYQCFIQPHQFIILTSNQGNPLIALALSWQKQFIRVLRKHLPTEDALAVGTALLLGVKDAISEDIRNAYIETGAMHILAISGAHIILIFGHLERVLNIYQSGNRRWRWIKTAILIILIALFALLTGLGASVTRAAVMASFLAIGKAMHQRVSIYNVLAASALALLLYNPFWLLDVGFQLSFTAVIGIALFYNKFKKIFTIKNKLLRLGWSSVAMGLAAQLTVTPISLYYFHQFATYFWLSGLLASVVGDVALTSGVLLLMVDNIPFLGWITGKILFGSIWLMNDIIFIIRQMPYSVLDGFWLSLWAVTLIYGVLWGFIQAYDTRKLRVLFYPLSICIVLACMYAFSDIKSHYNKQLVIYNIPGNSLVEILDGKICYRFYEKYSKNFKTKNKIKFATQNYHNALKINVLNEFNFNEYVVNNDFIYHDRYMQIGSTKVLLLDRLPQLSVTLSNCFVVVLNNPKFDIRHLKQFISIRQIIFDASNSKWRVEKWKKECEELDIDYYDVAEKGAWIFHF